MFVDFPLTPEVGCPSQLSCHPDYISIRVLDMIGGPDCTFIVGNCLTCFMFVFILCLSKPEGTFRIKFVLRRNETSVSFHHIVITISENSCITSTE